MSLQTFFPLVFDSTQLAEAKACETSFFRRHIQHLNGEESTDLIAGAAFAEGIHVARRSIFTEKKPVEEGVADGIAALYTSYGDHYNQWKEAKSVERMALALESYFSEYNPEYDDFHPVELADGSHAMEYNLMAEIIMPNGEPLLHPTLGLPLLFNGRLDLLAEYAGEPWLVDEKTTGSYFNSGWPSSWNMRDQFTAYCWLAGKSGKPELERLRKCMIRGISLPSSTSKNEETRRAFYADIGNIKHMIAPTYRTDFMIENWYHSMIETVVRLKQKYESFRAYGEKEPSLFFMKNGGSHCVSYGRNCFFTDSCMNQNDEKYLEVEEQYIWRPDLAKRQLLSTFLEELSAMQGN